MVKLVFKLASAAIVDIWKSIFIAFLAYLREHSFFVPRHGEAIGGGGTLKC